MPVLIGEDILEVAFVHAREIGGGAALLPGVLYAPLDDDGKFWLERLWDTAEGAVRSAWQHGRAAAEPLIAKFHEQVAELGAKAADYAASVRRFITERINDFFRTVVAGALERVQPTIKVAGLDVKIRGVTVEQTLKMSGSLKASLEELCEFVAEGEIAVSAEYGMD
jgi:hypothetical protein